MFGIAPDTPQEPTPVTIGGVATFLEEKNLTEPQRVLFDYFLDFINADGDGAGMEDLSARLDAA